MDGFQRTQDRVVQTLIHRYSWVTFTSWPAVQDYSTLAVPAFTAHAATAPSAAILLLFIFACFIYAFQSAVTKGESSPCSVFCALYLLVFDGQFRATLLLTYWLDVPKHSRASFLFVLFHLLFGTVPCIVPVFFSTMTSGSLQNLDNKH